MRNVPAVLLSFACALLALPSTAWSDTDKALVCHAAGKKQGGVSKLIPLAALEGHLKHNDCRLDSSYPVNAACDPSDPDLDGSCGVACDPLTQVCPGSRKCGDGAGPGGADVHCS